MDEENEYIRYYAEDRVFEERTVELADNYAIVFINESACYKEITKYFNENKPEYITSEMPHYCFPIRNEYFAALARVKGDDKRHFAALCRMVLWNHYAEEFNLRRVVIKSSNCHKKESEGFSNDLLDEAIKNLNNAKAHFNNVEIKMNTLTKFEKVPVATVKLIHGRPIEDYTEAELIGLIRKANEQKKDIADLVSTSKRMAARDKELTEAITVYTEALDNLPTS